MNCYYYYYYYTAICICIDLTYICMSVYVGKRVFDLIYNPYTRHFFPFRINFAFKNKIFKPE